MKNKLYIFIIIISMFLLTGCELSNTFLKKDYDKEDLCANASDYLLDYCNVIVDRANSLANKDLKMTYQILDIKGESIPTLAIKIEGNCFECNNLEFYHTKDLSKPLYTSNGMIVKNQDILEKNGNYYLFVTEELKTTENGENKVITTNTLSSLKYDYELNEGRFMALLIGRIDDSGTDEPTYSINDKTEFDLYNDAIDGTKKINFKNIEDIKNENKQEGQNVKEQPKSSLVLNKYYVGNDSRNPKEDIKKKRECIEYQNYCYTFAMATYFKFLDNGKVIANLALGEIMDEFTFGYETYIENDTEFIKIIKDKDCKKKEEYDCSVRNRFFLEESDKDEVLFTLKDNVIKPVDENTCFGLCNDNTKLKLYEGE